MDVRPGSTRRPEAHGRRSRSRWRLPISVVVAVATLVTLGATAVSAGIPGSCQVRNSDGGRAFPRLQAAVDAARRGDRLTVRGTCRGSTIIDRKLQIVGARSQTLGRPILSGAGKTRVLRVEPGVSVKLQKLTILRGKALVPSAATTAAALAAPGKAGNGGGIINRGNLTLIDVQVHRNTAGQAGKGGGGGVYNKGTLTLKGSTKIRGNFSPAGGGVYNKGTLRMKGSSSISGNGAESAGGVYNEGTLTMGGSSSIRTNGAEDAGGVTNLGTLTMNGSSTIRGNTGGLNGAGGGVFNGHTGTLSMNDSSSISGNSSVRASGGGVANDGGIVRLDDSSTISGNAASGGAGVSTWGKGTFTMRGFSTISGNTSENGDGGGAYVGGGTFKMSATSAISGNTANASGGGLFRARGTLTGVTCGPQTFANVYGNSPDDCHIAVP